jgi:hypothetical protein
MSRGIHIEFMQIPADFFVVRPQKARMTETWPSITILAAGT